MKKLVQWFIGLLVICASFSVNASIESSDATTLTRFLSYNAYGDGDVAFQIANKKSQCFGYWINKNDPGFYANYSLLLAAHMGNKTVKVSGYTDQRWSGSSNLYCKLYHVEFPN